MHELSLARSIEAIVWRVAGERAVSVVELDVGELRQVVPETLEACWGMLCAGTPLSGSRLEVRRIPGVIHCLECGTETRLGSAPILRCNSCAKQSVEIVSGEEFMVTAVQLEE
ncbi:MAG: hydrogenase maturation nickel metallochaperone HypA [Propionibacteriaceae bacterium]|jgi:hydrogenase nickel incorporation protein HypA/HybF|nr:hydrogenase maturation nickel metallochaperone HypA [Propionibacteriaceae bacterium]